jgi:YHS domain-containing protein
MAVFVEDPARYLNELGVRLPDFLDSTRTALLDPSHRSRINFENYFFAHPGDKERFDARPAVQAGILTDPVSRVRFRPVPASPRLEHGGHPWFFESDSTRALFAAQPDSFPINKARMIPGDEGK